MPGLHMLWVLFLIPLSEEDRQTIGDPRDILWLVVLSLIYDGPVPLRALYAIRRHLKMTRFSMGSQCNSFIAPVTWSNFLKSVTNFVAAFWASWSRLRTYCGKYSCEKRTLLLSSLEITWACTTVFVWSWVRYCLIFPILCMLCQALLHMCLTCAFIFILLSNIAPIFLTLSTAFNLQFFQGVEKVFGLTIHLRSLREYFDN